jgi:SAM-dependent methyltransferase
MEDRTVAAVDGLVRHLEGLWLPADMPAVDRFFGYGFVLLSRAVEGLEAAACLTEGRDLLDLGCGLGTLLTLAALLGWHGTGVERHPPLADAARVMVPTGIEIVTANAFDLDHFDADVVYAYRLCVDDDDERQLVEHVAARVRPGALLWLPEGDAGAGLREVVPAIWQV